MKNIWKEEMDRALRSRGMFLAVLIGILLCAAQVIQYQIPAYRANLSGFYEKFPIMSPNIFADRWLAGNPGNLEGFIYFLILPLLAALPFGTSYFEDNRSGYLKGIYLRISRSKYLSAKYMAAFLGGGIAVTVPLLLNLMCSMVLLPGILPQPIFTGNTINAASLLYEIYFSHPLIYIGMFLILDFLMAGMWACVALCASFLSDYKIIVLICPFFIQLALHVISTILDKLDCSSVYFAQAGYGIRMWWVPVLYLAGGILITWILFSRRGEKEDVF